MLRIGLFCLFILSAFYTEAKCDSIPLKKLSGAQLIEDVQYLVQTIENVHPNPYHDISQQDFYALRDAVIASFTDSMTIIDAWPKLAVLAAAINEGHTDIRLPKEFSEEASKGNILLFPIAVSRAVAAGLLVRADLSGDGLLQAGDTIQKINGIPAAELVQIVSSGVGGLQSWREQQVIPDLIAQLYLHGIRAPYTVTYKRGTEVYTTPVKALKLHELQAQIAALRKNAPPAPKPLPFSFVRMDKNIGYINFTNMRSPVDTFRKFLNETFSDIKQNGLRGLVIDLRQNGGGNSMLGYALLHYITDKSFRMAGGGLWKVSREYKSYMQTKGLDTGKLNTVTKQYLAMDNGKVMDIKPSKPQKTGKNNLRYKGNVVVLIGPKTFSSANMTANTIQDYKLATLIGEATGEPANDYGELYDSRLPHTGFQFVTSSKMFIRANGNKEDKNPVLPDITVEQNPDSDRDNVLDFAIQWLKRQKKSGK